MLTSRIGFEVCKILSRIINKTEPCSFAQHQSSRQQQIPRQSRNLSCSSDNNNKKMLEKMLDHLPLFVCGEIVRGFGRGSKELGIPTANYSLEVVKSLPEELQTGAYYGWANIDNGEVEKMVMSIGWNPFYDNKEKSLETHILHDYNQDLYGRILKICIVGYLRPERNFDSLEDLIKAIQQDITNAKQHLDADPNKLALKDAPFFKE